MRYSLHRHPRKYRNRPTGRFDSKREAAVYLRLCALRHAHNPRDRVVKIERQVRFELVPQQRCATNDRVIERAVTYVADFVVTYYDGRREVIDVKSPVTRKLPVYVIKRKLMLWRHAIRVTEM